MVDWHGVGRRLVWLLVRGVETALALLVLLSVWLLVDVPSGPDAPEQAGTFTVGFLFSLAFATFFLVVVVGVHLLVGGYRLWSAGGAGAFRRPVARLAAELALGAGLAVVTSPFDVFADRFFVALAAPTVLGWAVLVHFGVGTVQFVRSQAGSTGTPDEAGE